MTARRRPPMETAKRGASQFVRDSARFVTEQVDAAGSVLEASSSSGRGLLPSHARRRRPRRRDRGRASGPPPSRSLARAVAMAATGRAVARGTVGAPMRTGPVTACGNCEAFRASCGGPVRANALARERFALSRIRSHWFAARALVRGSTPTPPAHGLPCGPRARTPGPWGRERNAGWQAFPRASAPPPSLTTLPQRLERVVRDGGGDRKQRRRRRVRK